MFTHYFSFFLYLNNQDIIRNSVILTAFDMFIFHHGTGQG